MVTFACSPTLSPSLRVTHWAAACSLFAFHLSWGQRQLKGWLIVVIACFATVCMLGCDGDETMNQPFIWHWICTRIYITIYHRGILHVTLCADDTLLVKKIIRELLMEFYLCHIYAHFDWKQQVKCFWSEIVPLHKIPYPRDIHAKHLISSLHICMLF